jgi:hypothetical protein
MAKNDFVVRGVRMLAILGLTVAALLAGCQVAPRSDPYVSAAKSYIAELDQWNPSRGMPPEPPMPAFLQCAGFDINPPALGINPDQLGTPQGAVYLDYYSRPMTNTYAYNCSRINRQRQKAYEAAVQKYRVARAQAEGNY